MPAKRIIYAAQALFAGPSPATGAQASGDMVQIHRLQSCSYDYTRKLEDVKQYGNMTIIDSAEIELPESKLSASYLATNVHNESGIGLYVGGDTSALTDILADTEREKNYYIRIVPDGSSAAGYTGTDGAVVGFGNGVLNSYQAQGKVGSFPTAAFDVTALDISWTNTSANFDTPAVTPSTGRPITGVFVTLPVATTGQIAQPTIIRPGDVTVDIAGAGFGLNNICIQSYDLKFDLRLEPIICLGSLYPTSREITFPVECSVNVEVLTKDMGTGRLSQLQCGDSKYDLSVILRHPTCDGSVGATAVRYDMKHCTLQSQNFNTSFDGKGQSCTMAFRSPVGSAEEIDRGLFISGSLV